MADQGKDTTAESVSYDPGSLLARNQAGDIVPAPAPKVPVESPSVDKEVLTDDSGEVTELVEEEKENNEISGTALG